MYASCLHLLISGPDNKDEVQAGWEETWQLINQETNHSVLSSDLQALTQTVHQKAIVSLVDPLHEKDQTSTFCFFWIKTSIRDSRENKNILTLICLSDDGTKPPLNVEIGVWAAASFADHWHICKTVACQQQENHYFPAVFQGMRQCSASSWFVKTTKLS